MRAAVDDLICEGQVLGGRLGSAQTGIGIREMDKT